MNSRFVITLTIWQSVGGVEPDVISYTTLISLYAKSNAVSKAEKLVEKMSSAGVEPNDVCLNSINSGSEKLSTTYLISYVTQG